MRAFFFGSSKRQLFGVYHPPRASPERARDVGVLFAYPGVQEYNAAHWAFRKLAGMLAREGFHALRFDWSSTGDSAGDVADGHPDAWLEDLETAAHELRDASGVTSFVLVGMRLGAALAALAVARGRVTPGELVLWEPVVSGAKYVAELEAQDRRENFQLLHDLAPHRDELVGYAFPPMLRRAIEQIDLREIALAASVKASIWTAAERAEYRALESTLARSARDVTLHHVPEDAAATNAGARESALLSNKILVAITEHLAARPRGDRAAPQASSA